MSETLPTLRKTVTIQNAHGLHARPAAKFVELSSKFQSEVFVYKDTEKVNGKSIMGLLTLAAGFGMELEIEAVGNDAQQAVDEICRLILDKFHLE